MGESIQKTIDIENILKSKMGNKARFVPRFAINWLKGIVLGNEEYGRKYSENY